MRPIDQNTASFHGRVAYDRDYGGLAFEDEGRRCASLLDDPAKRVLVMRHHGVLVLGESVAEAFDRLYHFERAAGTWARALATGRPLREMAPEVAERVASQVAAAGPEAARLHFAELRALLDAEGSDYAALAAPPWRRAAGELDAPRRAPCRAASTARANAPGRDSPSQDAPVMLGASASVAYFPDMRSSRLNTWLGAIAAKFPPIPISWPEFGGAAPPEGGLESGSLKKSRQ